MKYSESGKQKKKWKEYIRWWRERVARWEEMKAVCVKGRRKKSEFLRETGRKRAEVGLCECVSLSGWAEKYVKAING